MNSFYTILILCGIALFFLLLNIWKKLPKYVFLFLSVLIIVAVSWYSMDRNQESLSVSDAKNKPSKLLVFVNSLRDVVAPPGETRFSLPVYVSGKRDLDCMRMVIESDESAMTEQSFAEKVSFSLLSSDGTLLPATGIKFLKEENYDFPNHFVLKVFFVLPSELSDSEFRCVVENNLKSTFRISELSVGSVPSSDKNL